jgi:hypothetical protein
MSWGALRDQLLIKCVQFLSCYGSFCAESDFYALTRVIGVLPLGR